jgi:hypothetical protein
LVIFLCLCPAVSLAQGLDHANTGLEAQKRGDLDTAIARYTLAIEAGDLSQHNLADAFNNRGRARFYIGQFTGAGKRSPAHNGKN